MSKLSKFIIILLVVILVAVLAIGGFLISNLNEKNVLTNQEALDLGNSKYKEAINSYDKLNFGTIISFVNEGLDYYEITNINEVKGLYTTNAFSKFSNRVEILERNGSYYGRGPAGGGDISYLGYELKVDNISENEITYTVIKKYCANEEDWGLEPEQVQNITTKEESFIIVKENNIWKVDVDVSAY